MRALTVRQPWAWAIVHGGKDVENRTAAWSYRGPLAIHAGAQVSDRGLKSELVSEALLDRYGFHPGTGSTPERLGIDHLGGLHVSKDSLGAILGVVDLVDAHPAHPGCCESPWAEHEYAEAGGRTRRDIAHLVLADPRPLAVPVPAKGRLGLWTPDPDLVAAIQGQLADVVSAR